MSERKYTVPSLEEMLDTGLHFGHQKRRWHPRISPYLFGLKNKMHLFDLEKVREKLAEASLFLETVAGSGKKIIFVGTKRQAQEIVKREAERCGALFVIRRWLGGTLTNFNTLRLNLDRLTELEEGFKNNKFGKYTKKERLIMRREMAKLQDIVGGLKGMNEMPGAIFVIDLRREKTAVREATKMRVPVIALVDSNTDPTLVKYPIPGNDDATKAVELVVKTLADAVLAGRKEFADGGETSKTPIAKPVSKRKEDEKIDELKLSKHLEKALLEAGIKTVSQLKRLSKTDLKEIKGVEEKYLEEALLKIKSL